MEVLQEKELKHYPEFLANINWFIKNRPVLAARACYFEERGGVLRYILRIVDRHQLLKILGRLWNADEFLSNGGIRSLSKFHEHSPFVFGNSEVRYSPEQEQCNAH